MNFSTFRTVLLLFLIILPLVSGGRRRDDHDENATKKSAKDKNDRVTQAPKTDEEEYEDDEEDDADDEDYDDDDDEDYDDDDDDDDDDETEDPLSEDLDETGCPKVFKEKCVCRKTYYRFWKHNQKIKMVNCTNSRLSDPTVLQHIPDDTEVLLVSGNNFTTLDWNVFGYFNDHEALEVVDLSNNNIRYISGKSFHKVKHVKSLVLDHNDIYISGPNLHPRMLSNFESLEALHLTNAFTETVDSKWYLDDLREIFLTSNMSKLRRLHLEQNEIWGFNSTNMFCDLPSLRELYLGDNQLTSIEFSLDCLKQITYLDLQYNKIRRLDDKTLTKFEQLFSLTPPSKHGRKDETHRGRSINLKGNPFRCDCHLRNFYDWLAKTNISMFHREDYRCFDGYPVDNAGKQIMNIQKMRCPPPGFVFGGRNGGQVLYDHAEAIQGAQTAASVTHALLVILILLVATVAVILIILYRGRLQETCKPLVVKFQQSLQYRSIGTSEDQTPIPREVNV